MPPEIMEDMADAAGDAALEAYQTALDAGEDPSVAASQAIDAASTRYDRDGRTCRYGRHNGVSSSRWI